MAKAHQPIYKKQGSTSAQKRTHYNAGKAHSRQKSKTYRQGKRGSCINSKKPGIGKRIPGDSLHDRTGAGKCGTYDDTADGSWNPKLKNGNLRRIGPVRLQNRLQDLFPGYICTSKPYRTNRSHKKGCDSNNKKYGFSNSGVHFSPQSL